MPAPPLHSPRYKRFVALLIEARKEAGLTQVQVAKKLGKPQSWISKCERRERRVDPVELEDLAALYGKPLTFFGTRPQKKR